MSDELKARLKARQTEALTNAAKLRRELGIDDPVEALVELFSKLPPLSDDGDYASGFAAGRAAGWDEARAEAETRHSEALLLYANTREKFITSAMDDQDRDYWQGRKDGMRVTLALVAPDPEDRERWERIQDSTPKSYTDILAALPHPADSGTGEAK